MGAVKLKSVVALKQQREAAKADEPVRDKPPKRKPLPPEQLEKNRFTSVGMAYRKTPVIDTMLAASKLSQDEYKALAYYRDQASLADKSPIRSNCDFSVRGGGNGPGVNLVSAMHETARIERELGQLLSIARAVAVDDITIRAYYIDRRGKIPTKKQMDISGLELRMAAHRINTEVLR